VKASTETTLSGLARLLAASWTRKISKMKVESYVEPEATSEKEGQGDPKPATSNSANDRVAASIENWKKKLLDLTKRNRALNFRVNKVSTVVIVDEQPPQVFHQLYLQGQSMRFKAAPGLAMPSGAKTARKRPAEAVPGTQDKPEAPPLLVQGPSPEPEPVDQASTGFEDEVEDAALELDFVPYDRASLDKRHTDQWLQTAALPDGLDKSLRRLDEQARLSIEEQGVNTLFLALGMLHYTESADSEQIFKAPIVLLPVALTRKSARADYQLAATEEDPIVNPALAEHARSFGITLPDLPDSEAMPEDYDLQSIFSAASDQIDGRKNWSIKTDIYLGLFSFQKFVMYKDLEVNAEAFMRHRLVRQLVLSANGPVIGLPAEINSMDLDQQYPPETTFQVVDADSSQLRTIAACAGKCDLVVEGPPGTGKSQTITNLIAQALASDKSVLFVAAKMAALDVVHRRLVQAGLGEACLELHSTKTNKRLVMKELAAALDASLQSVAAPVASTKALPGVRTTLSEYVDAVHSEYGALGLSPYRAYGELGRVISAPRVKCPVPPESVTADQLDQAVRQLDDLAAAAVPIGPPEKHAWRDTTKVFYSEDDLASVKEYSVDLRLRTRSLIEAAEAAERDFDFPAVSTLTDLKTISEIADVLSRSPGVPIEILRDRRWNAPPPEAMDLIRRGQEIQRLKDKVRRQFTADVLKREHSDDIKYIRAKALGPMGFLAVFDGRYRSIKRRWLAYRLQGFQCSITQQAAEMEAVELLRSERAFLAGAEARGLALFGDHWEGEHSSWDALGQYTAWVIQFSQLCVKYQLKTGVLKLASQKSPDLSFVDELRKRGAAVTASLADLSAAVGWPAGYLERSAITQIVERAAAIEGHILKGPQWAAFEMARRTAVAGLAAGVVPLGMNSEAPFPVLSSAFLRAFYMSWLSLVIQARPQLAAFHTLTHEQRVAEFRRLDQRVLLENRAALVSQLRDRLQHRIQKPEIREQWPHLQKQLAKQRGLAPIRGTMKLAGRAMRAVKPCFLMSPLTVSQLLDGSAPAFDLVIFDEASQLPPEDAVATIARGAQLVVVGDPNQLPPTNFFMVTSGQVNAPTGDDGSPVYEDSDSILELCLAAGLPKSRLKWHYRSAYESLISFSNVSFYDSELYTFPNVETGTATGGLQFEYVPNGVYEGKGLNLAEARRVADAVMQFATQQIERRQHSEPMRSLGVGTFNLRQQLGIQDEIERRRRENPSVDSFFAATGPEPFFVKNLENIQGDERDVIFISVTYARAEDGRLRYNFGPLNAENGWRRLNVLTTRARQRMRVFSSIRGDDINTAATTSKGAKLLRDFLLYAEKGRLDRVIASSAADTESFLERDVLGELSKRGLTLVPQVGVAGYKIDLGVIDEEAPGRFLCGIECDGVAYHSSETARDRDRLRQQVLEARGWTIHRVWSTDWFKDRAGQIDRLLALVGETRALAREERASEQDELERAAVDAGAGDAEQPAETGSGIDEVRTDGSDSDQKPEAPAYVFASGEGQYADRDLISGPLDVVVSVVKQVVDAESPVHILDVLTRVSGMWSVKLGSRIKSRIVDACSRAARDGLIERRGDFCWKKNSIGAADDVKEGCAVRSRAGTRIPPERVAPEEYREAVLMVLSGGQASARQQLKQQVRSLLGYGRGSPALEDASNTAIDLLLHEGMLGEGSTGICMRK
jgi:very-short-patch-repair endonuclease